MTSAGLNVPQNAPLITNKWSKLEMTCVFGLLILFALAGYLAFCWYSILGVAIYGLVLLVAFVGYLAFIWKSTLGVKIYGLILLVVLAGYLVFIQGQVFYGLVVLGLTLLVSAEIFSIWNSILRIMIRGAFIAVFFWTAIVIWNNEGDFTKVQPLLLALVTAFLTQVVSQFLKNSSDSDK